MRVKLIFEDGTYTEELYHSMPTYNTQPLSIKHKGRYWDLVVNNLTGSWPSLTYVEGSLNRYMVSTTYNLDLERAGGFPSYEVKCECGADKLGHPGHSDWCPKGKKLGDYT